MLLVKSRIIYDKKVPLTIKAIFNLEKLIYIIEKEHQKSGFLNGYLAAVKIMKGESVINEEVYSTLINMF